MEADAVGDTRQRVTRWMQEAPSFLEMVAHVVDDRQRAFDVADACQRECDRLRGELASTRAEVDALRRDQQETADALADVIGKAGEAVRRLRAAPDGASGPVSPAERAAGPAGSATPAPAGQHAADLAAPHTDRAPVPMEAAATSLSEPAFPGERTPAATNHADASAERGTSAEGTHPSAAVEPAPAAAPERATASSAAQRPVACGARRILLVDDDANFRTVMTEYLEGFRAYELRVAASGEEGLRALADAEPDIVLLDLMMPGIGGMATLERMKSECPDLPIVMVTANEDLSFARKALSLGACDYVTKPFDLDYLDAVLNIYLSKTDPRRERELEVLAGVDGAGAVTAVTRTIKSYFSRR
jgi:CheY-like chemotaxis protein